VTLADWLADRWISADWQLSIAYNAALQLATLALVAEGYRPGRERAHERAILSLRHTAGIPGKTVDLLDAVRRKRNQAHYEQAGTTSVTEAQELHQVAKALRGDVVRWLKRAHPDLCPPGLAREAPT